MTKDEFGAMAKKNHFEPGDWFIVYRDESISVFTLGVDSYSSVWESRYTPGGTAFQEQSYRETRYRAALSTKTLYEGNIQSGGPDEYAI